MTARRPIVTFTDEQKRVEADVGDNLLDLILEQGIAIKADCGGVGTCGKCRVLVDGEVQHACLTRVVRDTEVLVVDVDAADGYAILTEFREDGTGKVDLSGATSPAGSDLAVAIDIGTTTIVGKLLDRSSGIELASFAQLNSELPYGADVISRIKVCLEDASTLSSLITEQIDTAISDMLASSQVDRSSISRVVLAGNTTMVYILLNLPCQSLGFSPFIPEIPVDLTYPYTRIFHTDTLTCDCTIIPFISGYVGGDITAGLLSLASEDDFILMDMGTNGELVFKRGDHLICTATAAGPAFEGGNIECGSGSVRGAISKAWFEDGKITFKTIGGERPVGICGSGILDLGALLVRERFIDETGYLDDDLGSDRIVLTDKPDSDPEVYFSQKDVRQFQLAKSATRTGLEIIIDEMGGALPSKVFLAGGFGQNLDPASAIATGMLPESFAGRVSPIGNSSLNGAIKACLNDALVSTAAGSIEHAVEINLGSHPKFNDLFMDQMAFPTEP